jgi:hypothetical protein
MFLTKKISCYICKSNLKIFKMKKLYTLSFILLASLSFGQISITAVNTPYNETFDGMGATGTTFANGWTAIRASGTGVVGATLTMVADNGSLNSGNVYNLGATASTERSFGTLASGSTVPSFGASFANNTGVTVTDVSISAVVEQWREASNATLNEIVSFSYSLDATSLSTGTWTPVTALDLLEIKTATTINVAVDGNLAANQANISGTISGLSWANGSTLWIKWDDANDVGSDATLAIDNFVFKANPVLSVKQNSIAGLNVYPNPVTDGNLYITSNSSNAKTVAVYDILGKQVLNSKTLNNSVNVSNLKGGAYIVRITEDGKTDTRKLIIQ